VDRAHPLQRKVAGRERTVYRLKVTKFPVDWFVRIDG
jgi:hypothetical protein